MHKVVHNVRHGPTKLSLKHSSSFQERIERLIESIILEQNKLDVNDTLPNVQLDKTSIAIDREFSCEEGHVVAENECGE